MNQFNIDYDYPGLCSKCHAEVAEFDGSLPNGRPRITKLLGTFRESTLKLDDGSSMKIAMCDKCYEGFTAEDIGEIMESVINGWQKEVDDIKGWDKTKKLDHMTRYSKRHAVGRVDKMLTEDEIKRITRPSRKNLKVKVKEE